MWNYNLLTALQSVEKCMGFVLHRWLIFLAFAGGFLLATLAGAGTAVGIGSLSANPLLFAHFGAIAGFALFAWLARTLRRTLYRSVRLPHFALLTKLARRESIPEGRAQVEFARRSAAEQFPNPKLLWEIRQATRAVLAQLPHHAGSAATAAGGGYRVLADRVRGWLCAMNDDLIVAAIGERPGINPWQIARYGILVQLKNFPLLLKNRLALAVFEGIGWLLAYLLLLLAFQKVAAALPFSAGFWPHVFAFLFAWNIKASFLEPTAQAAMLQLQLEPPDAAEADEMAAKLAADCEAYRLIESRAASPEKAAQIA